MRPLLDTYGQIQTFRPLYEFLDVDVDRYRSMASTRQVMVSARELSSSRLPADAQSWVNQRLQFTHGYGLVMSPVNEVVQEGLPSFFLQDIPVTGELQVTQPEIYYGEEPDHYVIVKTKAKEFDYPTGDGSTQTVFEGEGGVTAGFSHQSCSLFAWEFGDLNILISGSLTATAASSSAATSRSASSTLAPFLTLDKDPYLVLADGKLVLDPGRLYDDEPLPVLTARCGRAINYIRNSVKVVVDAYDGTTTFYLVDQNDPIIQTYANIFPDLFTPLTRCRIRPAGAHALPGGPLPGAGE